MSVFQVVGGIFTSIAVKLAGTSPVVIAGSSDSTSRVAWFQCTEIAGSTPDLTVELYDGTTSVYLRYQQAMAANEAVKFEDIALNRGQFLRVTAGAANQIDVVGLAFVSNALQ
jgi:hypothetical protein